ncbi:MAG: prolipoprotein diacylglyceryl transferase, partial [Eubacteriales bacterium]|nr:prolipoprotein diacylglyceryl transferase [Eubacteriales bacterium]
MTFTVGGITGYWYGLIAGLGVLAYLLVAGALGYAKRLPAGTMRLYGLVGIPLGLLFARLGFCAANYAYFTETVSQPWLMLHFWDGGFSLLGALCGLTLAALLTARMRKVYFGTMLDVTVAPIGILLFSLRLAEGFTGSQLGVGRQIAVGSLTTLYPWLFMQDQMGTLTLYRLAVYRYEAAAALLLLILSLKLFYSHQHRRRARSGDVGMIVYALFGAGQIILESLRDDGHMVVGFIRVQQVGYALMPLLALAVLGARYLHIRQKRGAVAAAWLLV